MKRGIEEITCRERERLNNKKVVRALKKQIARHESKKPRTHVYAERIVYFFDVIEHNTPLGCIPHCLHKCAHIPCLRVEVIVAERGESAKNNDVERDYCPKEILFSQLHLHGFILH